MKVSPERIGAIGGVLFVALQLVGQSLIQVGGSEPSFDATSQEIVEFFESRNTVLFNTGSYLSVLSLIALLGFLGSLWNVLRRAEGEPGSAAAASLWLAAFPRWLGWTGLIVGIWLVTAPIYWTSPVAFAPYVLFWVWLVSLSVVMFRRAKE